MAVRFGQKNPAFNDGTRPPARPAAERKISAWQARAWVMAGGLWLWAATLPAAPSFTASLNREIVPVRESVTLSLIFEGTALNATPNLPPLPNLTLVSSSQRSEFNFVNGQTTARKVFEYTLVPTRPGDITIPAMQVQVDGQTLTSSALKLSAIPGNAPPPPAPNNPQAQPTNLAFLRLVVPKTEVYMGEAFPVEMHLYWQNAQDIQLPQLKAEGFALGQSSKPAQTTTQIAGMPYNLAIFRLSATAAKSGQLTLGPAECNLTLLIPIQNRRRRDPFDMFGIFGPQAQARPIVLSSEAQSIRVLPLPAEGVPPNFNGAVGTYSMRVTAGPTNLAVGDPITLRVQISGQGPLEALTLPEQAQWHGFKTYPPTSKLEAQDNLGLAGSKTFEQVIIPQNHEITALPAFQFSFFDPNARSYRTLSSPPIPLSVQSTIAVAPPPVITNMASAQAPPPPVDDIVHIRARLDTLALARPPLVRQSWFLGLQAVPVLAWLGLLWARKRREALANNPRLRRQRQVAQRVRQGLNQLHTLAGGGQSDEFFATLFHLLQEQLGERLDVPASAITEAVIDEKLQDGALPAETRTELRALFQSCNQARYAPVKTSEELASLIPRAESALRQLQQMKA